MIVSKNRVLKSIVRFPPKYKIAFVKVNALRAFRYFINILLWDQLRISKLQSEMKNNVNGTFSPFYRIQYPIR